MTPKCSTAICTHTNTILCWTVLIALMLVTSPARAVDVFTDFESSATAPFSVGTSPFSADFSTGVVESRGRPELYTSGFFSWHILSGETATVTFVTPASALEFFTRTANSGVTSQIRVFDENNVEILSQTPTNTFQPVSVVRAAGDTLIGSFEVSVTSGGDIVIDDLSFTANAAVSDPAQAHSDLAQRLFAGNIPSWSGPFLAQHEGMGLVVRKIEQRGLFLLMVWRQQQARRCVTFWPSNVFDCDQGDLAFQVGRAALDALDAVESLGN